MSKLIKVAMIVAGVGAMLSFAGCGSAESKPEEVVLNVLKTMQSGKADQAFLNKCCDEDTAKLFSGFGSEMTSALKGATFTVANVFVDDDVAVVKIKQDGGKEPGEFYYDAKKVDGQWKIAVNKEAHSDYRCISQRSIAECVETFKALLRAEELKYKDRCSKEVCAKFQEELSKMTPKELEEMRRSLDGLRIKGHKKVTLDDDGVIEVECEMPRENGIMSDIEIMLKVVDGKWNVFLP